MIYLILGGSASGKSEYAEKLSVRLKEDTGAAGIYLATMKRSASAEERIRKHVRRRRGLGFETLENETLDISKADMDKLRNSVVLLEDLPNLLANRMFGRDEKTYRNDKSILDKYMKSNTDMISKDDPFHLDILKDDIERLERITKSLILVSGDIFREGICYDNETEKYIENLGDLHRWLAGKADRTVEVVCGIPLGD